jgi:hypothetical protein
MVLKRDSKKIDFMLFTFVALVFVMLTSIRVYAQVSGATMTGTVSDASGAVIPNAQVSIKNVATGEARAVTTGAAGFYSAPNLLPGSYEVTVTAPGFSTEVRSGLTLTVGAQQLLNITMKVGQVSEKVQVTGEAPVVQLATSDISGVVSQTTVVELPLNGRDWTQLATLQPGIVGLESNQPSIAGRTSGARVNRGYGTQLTISGARPGQNNYRVDGVSVNDYLNGSPGSVLGATLGVDAVQEFSVLTSNYSAEYGRTSGGVVNAITRSGTNQFHGDAYEFLRNDALDAANFFDITKPPFRRNQFGGSGGAPIRKDRTFVFADYEGLRQSLGVTDVNTVPTQNARNGILHNPDGTTATIAVSPLVKPYLALWALPNESLLGAADTGIFSFAAQSATTENFVAARIDHKISDADTLFGSYQFDKALTTLPESLNDLLIAQRKFRQLVTLEESHTFSPRLINSVRGGFNRVSAAGPLPISAINPAAADPSLAAVPGWDAPQIFVSGITTFQGGLRNEGFTKIYYNSFQGYDDAFLTSGIQSLKFGFAVERMQEYALQDNTDGGQFAFGSLHDFLTNSPSVLVAGLPGKHTPRYYRQSIFGGYVQDDVRWRPNLTFNLGLRYEMSTVPTDIHGELSNMRHLTDLTPHLGNPLFSNPTLRNFEPRIGFAWDPFRDGKTSVRGGFGLFDVLPLIYQYALTEVSLAPFTLQGRASPLPQGSFPTGAFSFLQGLNQVRVGHIQSDPRRNYVMQWNFNLQHELTPNLAATVAYVGSRSVHQVFRADDQNIVLPTLTSAGYLWPSPAGSGTVLNPHFGRMDYTDWGSNSFYDALELQIQKRMSHGFQVQGSYTWAKSIDEGSAGTLGDPFNNSISNLFFFDRKTRRGLSDYNIGQNLVINYVWNISSAKSLRGAAEWAFAGWQLGGIFQTSSGLPFTPLIGGDPLGGNNSSTYAYPNRLSGPGCQSAVNPGNPTNYIKLNCFALPAAPASFAARCTPFSAVPGTCRNLLGNAGRNSLPGPGLVNFDFSIFKNNYIKRISENFNVQFRAEFFNVFNRPNFLPPNDNVTIFDQTGAPVPGAGLIDATSTTAREIQFALKLMW